MEIINIEPNQFRYHGDIKRLCPDHNDKEKEVVTWAIKWKPHWWCRTKIKIKTMVSYNGKFVGRFRIERESEIIFHQSVLDAKLFHDSIIKEKIWTLNLTEENSESVFMLLHYDQEIGKDFTILTANSKLIELTEKDTFKTLQSKYPTQWGNELD